MTETSAPIRVPNVRPNARSGLSGEVIGSDAITAYEENLRLAAEGQPITGTVHTGGPNEGLLPPIDQSSGTLLVPAGDLDSRIAWVAEAETSDIAGERADAIWQHEQTTGDLSAEEMNDLAARLATAVHGARAEVKVPEDATTVDAVLAWVNGEEGDDPQRADRARAALAAEEERDEPRKTLVEPLKALIEQPLPE